MCKSDQSDRGRLVCKTALKEHKFRVYRTGYFGMISHHLTPKTTIPDECVHASLVSMLKDFTGVGFFNNIGQ